MLYANFRGKNPNEEKVEIAVRRNVFMPDKNGVNYITVSGFVLTKAATTWGAARRLSGWPHRPPLEQGLDHRGLRGQQQQVLRHFAGQVPRPG